MWTSCSQTGFFASFFDFSKKEENKEDMHSALLLTQKVTSCSSPMVPIVTFLSRQESNQRRRPETISVPL
jgi:hypothetical protein